jgi:hypothetical protein
MMVVQRLAAAPLVGHRLLTKFRHPARLNAKELRGHVDGAPYVLAAEPSLPAPAAKSPGTTPIEHMF